MMHTLLKTFFIITVSFPAFYLFQHFAIPITSELDTPTYNEITENPYCAIDWLHNQQMTHNPAYKQLHESLEKQYADFIHQHNHESESLAADYTLPVVVHIIHNNGNENISDAQVLQGIDHLNEAFVNMGYYDQGTGVNTQIEFCLAKRDPEGKPTTGITRDVSSLTEMVLETDDITVKDLNRWDPTQYINIWLVREICSASIGCGVAGYAFFPTSYGQPEDGIMVEAQWFGSSQAQSTIPIHEMGHYLGLYHTFQGGCTNNDCLVDGDRVCDTPPDQTTAPVPCNGNVNSCSTDANSGFPSDQDDMFWNYMDYGDYNCYSAFTQGQTDRMTFFINGIRSSLLDSDACMDPCPNPIALSVTPGDTLIDEGESLDFINTTTGATTFEWAVNGVVESNMQNFSYNFASGGSYEVSLTASNGDPNCTITQIINVVVIGCIGNAYVSNDIGVDAPGCGAPGSPCNTIQYALDSIVCPGDTVFILSGTYSLPSGTDPLTPIARIPQNYSVTFFGVEDNGPVIIDGQNERRGFQHYYVNSSCVDSSPENGINTNMSMNFAHLTIQNCYYEAGLCGSVFNAFGAGIQLLNKNNSQLNVDIRDCRFENNFLDDPSTANNNGRSASGAAVYVNGRLGNAAPAATAASLYIDGCAFISNACDQRDNGGHGGAVYAINLDSAQILNSYFCENSVFSTNSDSGDLNHDRNAGGAVLFYDTYNAAGPGHQYFIDNCIFVGNSATTEDGANFVDQSEGGAVFLTRGDVLSNTTTASVTISNSAFFNNFIETGIEHVDANSGTLNTALNNVFEDYFALNIVDDSLSLCSGGELSVNEVVPQAEYEWNTGDTGPSILVDTDGLYAVTITLGGCMESDSIYVELISCDSSEICGNGIDDDGDGLVDCYDPDCCEDCDEFYFNTCPDACLADSIIGPFDMVLEWAATGESYHEYGVPIVGDVDNDGIPEVIARKGPHSNLVLANKDLIVYDGQTGAVEDVIITPYMFYFNGGVAIGDLDGNGFGEIVIQASTESNAAADRRKLFCYEYDGSNYVQKWVSDVPAGYNNGNEAWSCNLADFNGDGVGEVYLLNQIFDGLTGELLLAGGAANAIGSSLTGITPDRQGFTVAVDILPDGFCPNCEGLELVAGNQIYSVHIDPANSANNQISVEIELNEGDGPTSIADFDKDGDLDVIVSGAAAAPGQVYVYVWDGQTTGIIATSPSISTSAEKSISLPNVADFDGDGLPEIGIASPNNYWVFEQNGTNLSTLWNISTTDNSGRTGSTVFDFNSDGEYEVVYRTQNNLVVIEGSTGVVLSQIPCTSGTGVEYPVTVDVDLDGQTEVLCGCGTELRAYRSGVTPWVSARPVWNQLSYFNVNINDDLSIPIQQQQHHIVGDSIEMNNFLVQYADPEFKVPDAVLSIDVIDCTVSSLLVEVQVCNEGDNPIPAGTPLTVYNGDPTAGPALDLFTVPLPVAIPKDSCLSIVQNLPPLYFTPVFGVINDDGSLSTPFDLETDFPPTELLECNYLNNIDSFLVEEPAIELDLEPDIVICDNGVAVLNAGSGFKYYKWQDGSSDSTYTVFEPGTYWVEVEDGCSVKTDTIVVGLDSTTVLDLGPDIFLCGSDSALISIDGFDEYQWIPSDFLDCDTCPTVVSNPPDSVTYVVIASTFDGCFSVDTIKVMRVLGAFVSIDTSICEGESFTFGGVTYNESIMVEDTVTLSNGCDSVTALDLTVLPVDTTLIDTPVCLGNVFDYIGIPIPPGETQSFQFQASSGCDSFVIVNVIPLDTFATFEEINICAGDSALIFGNFETELGVYSQTEPSVDNGCDSTSYITLNVGAAILIDISSTPSCAESASGSITTDVAGGVPPYQYAWSIPGETGPEVIDISEGNYTLTVTDADGCSIETSVEVGLVLSPDWFLDAQDISCAGLSDGEITAFSGGNNLLFSLDGSNFTADTVFSNLSAGVYDVFAQDSLGCIYSMAVDVVEPVDWSVIVSADTTLELGQSYEIDVNTNVPGVPEVEWIPSETLSCDDCLEPIASPTETTTYLITVTDPFGCVDTASITINIIVVCNEERLLIPNVFTPNGDGVNDHFEIVNKDGAEEITSFLIFDRWGELVFESTGRDARWDGTFKGKDMPTDVFVYLIEFLCPNGERGQASGDITLIR